MNLISKVDIEDCITPQFSSRDSNESENIRFDKFESKSFEFIKANTRYEEENFESEENMSFSLKSFLINQEIEYELSMDTLGSPSSQQQIKVPPLYLRNKGNLSERGIQNEIIYKNESKTERRFKDPLLVLEINFKNGIKRVEIYEGDTALKIAKMLSEDFDLVEELACRIETEVNKYCNEIKNLGIHT